MSDIITALKRLERAGSEDSRETQKLLAAAKLLAEHVARILPPEALETSLPRGYTATGNMLYLPVTDERVDNDRHTATRFAYTVAHGLLSELADWLEARTAGSAEAGATLRRAAECFATR